MAAGHRSGRFPGVRIEADDFDNPEVGIFTSSDGVVISGNLRNPEGERICDPQDNNKPFRLEIGIEDWVVAMQLGSDLIDAAMYLRRRGLQDVMMAEAEDERSALLTPPDPDHEA